MNDRDKSDDLAFGIIIVVMTALIMLLINSNWKVHARLTVIEKKLDIQPTK